MIEQYNGSVNSPLKTSPSKLQNDPNLVSLDNNRKYNSKNIDNGKKFFKNRFIEYLKQQKQSNKPPGVNIKTNQSRVSFSIDKIELKKKKKKKKKN